MPPTQSLSPRSTGERHHNENRPAPRSSARCRPSKSEGRLLFPTGHGRRSLVVAYHRIGSVVTLRIPEFSEAGNYLDGAQVTLEPRVDADETASSAGGAITGTAITGTGVVVEDAAVPAGTQEALEKWPPGIAARFFVIVPGPGAGIDGVGSDQGLTATDPMAVAGERTQQR